MAQYQNQGFNQRSYNNKTTYADEKIEWATMEQIHMEMTNEKSLRKLEIALHSDKESALKFAQATLRMVADSEKTGTDERALYHCDPVSIVNAAVTAASLGLPVDGRQLCYLVRYKNKVKLTIGYKGYVYKITEQNATANIQVGIVFPGDKFRSKKKDGVASFTHDIGKDNDFRSDYDAAIGAYCYITYFIGKKFYADLEKIGMEEIATIRGKAKTDKIWKEWLGEKMKVAVIRRASKLGFTQATAKLDAFDNLDYDMEKPVGIGHNSNPGGNAATRLANRLKKADDAKGQQTDKLEQPGDKPGVIIDGTATEIQNGNTGGSGVPEAEAAGAGAFDGDGQGRIIEGDAQSGEAVEGHSRSTGREGDADSAYGDRPQTGQQEPVQTVRADEPAQAADQANQGQAVKETIDWTRTYVTRDANIPFPDYHKFATPELAYPSFLAVMASIPSRKARKELVKDNREYLDALSRIGHEAKVQFIHKTAEEGA